MLVVAVLVAALAFGRARRAQIQAARVQAPAVRIATVQAGTIASGWRAQTAPDLLAPTTDDLLRSLDLETTPEFPAGKE